MYSFQPTRPRRARLNKTGDALTDTQVSTHAPTKGATQWRAPRTRYNSFNPRAHEGRDKLSHISVPPSVFQPTRPRRARQKTVTWKDTRCSFNPRAHEGRDRHS